MRLFKNDMRLIETLIELHKLGIKDIHLLGSSRLGAVCISAYLARNNYFHTISMDSGTWRRNADLGKLVVPYDLRVIHISDTDKLKERIMKLPASWQKKIKNVLAKAGGKEEHCALREFNYHAIEATIKDILTHAASPFKMKEYLLERSTRIDDINKIISQLKMITPKLQH